MNCIVIFFNLLEIFTSAHKIVELDVFGSSLLLLLAFLLLIAWVVHHYLLSAHFQFVRCLYLD